MIAARLLLWTCALVLAASAARAQAAPPFAPGLYETESRNSALPNSPVKATVCMKFADYAAFRDETMASYRAAPPQFKQDCRLGELREIKDGFTLSMQCQSVTSVLTYAFEPDLVRLTTLTLMGNATKPLATILTTMRRVGDCPAAK
jgi:hypothetical protein